MKHKKYRWTALLLAAAMTLGCVGVAYAGAENGTAAAQANASGMEKEETVYVLSKADGSVNQIIVSDHLKNPEGAASIPDSSSLSDIENVKGEETFTAQGGKMVWAANGGDIYYQGTSDKELPLDVHVKYTLDGREIAPEELAGKSGKVTMRFDYVNKQKETVQVDGKQMEVSVPFVVMTGLVLEGDHFKNVTVENGKVLDDGDRYIVTGMALPGWKESLELTGEEIEIPEYVEITADVTDFSLTASVSVALSNILDELDLADIDDIGDLTDSLNDLSQASTALVEGTEQLYDGVSELAEKSGTLTSGIDKLNQGSRELKDGSRSLAAGTGELASGMKDLSSNMSGLTDGLKDAAAGGNALQQGCGQLTEGARELSNGVAAAQAGLQSLSDGMDTAYGSLTQTIAANEKVLEGLKAVYAQMPSEDIQTMIGTLEQTTAGQKQIAASLKPGNQGLKDGVLALQSGGRELADGAAALQEGIGRVSAGAGDLQNGLNQAYAGSQALNDGAQKLYQGSAEASQGAAALQQGSSQLNAGIGVLKDGSGALIEGIGQLKEGTLTLRDGMAQFDEEGIRKLVDAFDGDLQGLVEHFKAMQKAAEAYNNYSGLRDGMAGSVKFIYKTDEIGE